ncbi:YceI family protein [Flavicella sp.]|uniref:YceI family protein n=1 Tax=Flavicella sp. TaxID=2957742 RepID=UPI003016A3AC
MKTKVVKLTAVALVAFIGMSFSVLKNEVKQIKTRESKVSWIGKKEIGSDHQGTINIKSGFLEFKKDQLVGGEISIDMSSITVTSLEGNGKKKLENHLKTDDFFGTDNFKTSNLIFTKVTGDNGQYNITGDFTIKGITKSITFDLNITGSTATANLEIDRTIYGIKYGSSSFFDDLKDKAIKNNFELNVKLVF